MPIRTELEYNSLGSKILIIDDEKETRDIFRRQLQDEYDIDTAESAQEGLKKFQHNFYHIVMTDLVMPGVDGFELMRTIKARFPQVGIIAISGKASVAMAVEAMKLGADEFIEKPVQDLELITLTIKKILKIKWQQDEIRRLREILAHGFDRTQIIGVSLKISKLLEKVKHVAPLDTTLLISGETGVGKEVFADLIHRNSKRKDNKFVAVNCGGIPENLLESMLFGHKKGSFTGAINDKIGYFEEANGGTLFLDEITETSLAFQIKLLRVLEKGVIRKVGDEKDIVVDARIVAATNRDIRELINSGVFREDLYYRLNVINLSIPPLRERIDDIQVMANHFVEHFRKKHNKTGLTLSDSVLSILLANEWRGNVRELKNAIEHAVVLARHNIIMPEDLPSDIYTPISNTDELNIDMMIQSLPYSQAKTVFEKQYIINLLKRCHGDISAAALESGIKRQNMYEKFSKYHIDIDDYRA